LTSDETSAWAFHVRQYPAGRYRTRTYRGKPGYKTLIKPSRKALQRHRDRLRDIIQHHRGAPQAGLVYALNPVIQGWANYYQHCTASPSAISKSWTTPSTINSPAGPDTVTHARAASGAITATGAR
jgi:hypothetical protein